MTENQQKYLPLLLKTYDLIQAAYSSATQATALLFTADGILVTIAVNKKGGELLIMGGIVMLFLFYILYKGGKALAALYKITHNLEKDISINENSLTKAFLSSFRDQRFIEKVLTSNSNHYSLYDPSISRSSLFILLLGIAQIIIGIVFTFLLKW